ncbi:hypothetical protein F5879DRAFT_984323 [Lentinula edodes]|nr:hypothetical protein F5879DRAFT_984323 [Lentinula edodes]
MSIFARPESPPPRAPSPDYCAGFNPLPIRSKKSQASMRPMSCDSDVSKQKPVLRSVHSLDTAYNSSDATHFTNNPQLLGHDLSRRPSKGILKASPPPSPSFASISSRSSTSSSRGLVHSRSLQLAVPYRSPPASPILAAPPPPVPPIPALILPDAEENDEEKNEEKKKKKDAIEEKSRKRRHSRAGEELDSLLPGSHSVAAVACTCDIPVS